MGAAEGLHSSSLRPYDLIMSVVVTAFGAIFFLFVSRAIGGYGGSAWIVPIIIGMLYIASLALFAITVGVKRLISPIIFISFLPSIIFMPTIGHIVVVCAMFFLAMRGLLVMRNTLFNLLQIKISVIMRSGISPVVFAIIIIVTSQYYLTLRETSQFVFDAQEYVAVSHMITDALLRSNGNDDISDEEKKTMTVDEMLYFIVQNVFTAEVDENSAQNIPTEADGMILRWAGNAGIQVESVRRQAETEAVTQIRSDLSELIGREIRGDELAATVMSEIISLQLNNIIAQNRLLQQYQAEIFAGVVFLILLSLGSVARVAITWIVQFLFMLLREYKVIRVTRSQREAEVIAL